MIFKHTYILGAGFSRPMGLPVMSEFLDFAKSIHNQNPDQYPHFRKIFDLIHRLHSIKEFTEQDLTNIESILSLLEMGSISRSDLEASDYKDFIKDVIKAYMPKVGLLQQEASDFVKMLGRQLHSNAPIGGPEYSYLVWLAGILGIGIDQGQNKLLIQDPYPIHINFITLNYDNLLEYFLGILRQAIAYAAPEILDEIDRRISSIQIIHLHGTVDSDIMAPIWTKHITPQKKQDWRTASEALGTSNTIIFLGYSLPESDSYFRYFLSLALMESLHIQKIKVLCRDTNDQQCEKRYIRLFTPIMNGKFHFGNGEMTEYLRSYIQNYDDGKFVNGRASNRLPNYALLKRHLTY